MGTTVSGHPRAGIDYMTSAQPPLAVLVDVSPRLSASIVPVLLHSGYEVTSIIEIDAHITNATMMLVEGDRGARMRQLARRTRTLNQFGAIVGVMNWWNEDEPEARRVTDAMLHAPVRPDHIQALVSTVSARTVASAVSA